jgi:hypothetical protein
MALRGTVGKLGGKIAESGWANKGVIGRGIGNIGRSIGGKSFDFRNTQMGAKANSAMNKELDIDMGKGKTGGYTKQAPLGGFRDQLRAPQSDPQGDHGEDR